MDQIRPGRHLEALVTIAATAGDRGALPSGEALRFLRQYLRLRDAHVCRADEGDGPRRVLDLAGDRAECALPQPRLHQLGCKVETDEGWVAGFVVSNPPDQAVLHLSFEHAPAPDDLASGFVAATLIAGMLPARGGAVADRDPLTGLPGRAMLEQNLLEQFAARDPTRSVSLILADVNGLKTVNDRLGHPSGDRLLRRVAAVIADVAARLDADAVAARIGGDEFAIAASGVGEDTIQEALGRIHGAARDLGGDTGIGCGAARLPGHAPGSPSSAVAMHGLVRLADAQLYASKPSAMSVRTPRPPREPQPGGPSLPAGFPATLGPRAGQSVEQRLVSAARLIAGAADAAAWWVSRQDGDALVDTRCGTTRRKSLRWDEPERPVVLESNAYPLDDFPATRRALAGGYLHASLIEGDAAERAMLAYFGYRSVVAAGGIDRHGQGWLVEIYGDYLTDDVAGWGEILQLAVKTAMGPD